MGDVHRLLFAASINGLTYAATLFLVAVGLSLIYGVVRVLNVAHGSFYALGAFATATAWIILSKVGLPPYLIYLGMAIGAVFVGVALAPFIERVLLRWIAGRESAVDREYLQLLSTYAIFLMLEDIQKLIWGVQPYYSGGALRLLGTARVAGMTYTNYQLALVPVALVVLFGLRTVLKRTRIGKFVRAVAEDPEVAGALGIRVGRMYTVAFTIGAILAALGGALASPTTSVVTGMGAQMMVLSFAVVAIAGLGRVEGAALAALLIGLAHSFAVFFMPQLSSVAAYLIMLGVLAIKPYGLFGVPEQRRI